MFLSKGELISDILWTPTHGHASVGRLPRTYLHLVCVDTGCNLEDMQGVVDDRDRWRKKVREICADSTT